MKRKFVFEAGSLFVIMFVLIISGLNRLIGGASGKIEGFAGVTYYVAADGNDNGPGTSEANPWKSIDKVNSAKFQPGDRILFKRGGVWRGQLIPSSSGDVNRPVTFGSYGSGDKPLISGLVPLAAWESVGNGIWQSDCQGCSVKLNIVSMDDALLPIGRYPNASDANKGYLSIDQHSGNTSITDNNRANSTDWTGAEIVIRKNRWVIDRSPIVKQDGGTIYYTATSSYNPIDKFGYFIQNSAKTLDSQGEWYFNSSAKKLMLYSGTAKPKGEVKVSTIEKLVSIGNKNYVTIDGLEFDGANTNSIEIKNSKNVKVINCKIAFSGVNAVLAASSNSVTISNCIIENSNNNAIDAHYNCDNLNISKNQINNSGRIAGMGLSGDGSYTAIIVNGDNNKVDSNQIVNTGYIPIVFRGNTDVEYNFINNYANIKDDGGGIYTRDSVNVTRDRNVTNNIVINGVGAGAGTNKPDYLNVTGIYVDDNCKQLQIVGNTLAYNGFSGIFIHNSNSVTVKNNTVFSNGRQILMRHDEISTGSPVRSINIAGNVFATTQPSQLIGELSTINNNEVAKIGKFSNNHYLQAPGAKGLNTLVTSTKRTVMMAPRDLPNSDNKKDNSDTSQTVDGKALRLEYNPTNVAKTIKLDGAYADYKNNIYNNTVTLSPFSSIILIKR